MVPGLTDTDIVHMIKWTRSPYVIAYCKQSKTGRKEALGTIEGYLHYSSSMMVALKVGRERGLERSILTTLLWLLALKQWKEIIV